MEKRWQEEQRRREDIRKTKEAERKRIQDEFEAEQKRIAQVAEEKLRREEEMMQMQEDLQRRIQEFVNSDGEMPPELHELAETNPGKELCTYFNKNGACRFGNKCSKNHIRPKISTTLFVPGFFSNIHLEHSRATEYGNDLTLEFEEYELYKAYQEFFEDIAPEFQKYGRVEHLVTCQNYEPHYRGNVYVEYSNER